jgi:hypothetical protein
MLELLALLLPLVVGVTFILLLKTIGGQQQQQQQRQQWEQHDGQHAVGGAAERGAMQREQQQQQQNLHAANGAISVGEGAHVARGSEPNPASGAPLSPAAAPSPPASADTIPLRFLRGEHPVVQHNCSLKATIRTLKVQVYPQFFTEDNATSDGVSSSSSSASAAASPSSSGPKVMFIFRGQLLRDQQKLEDYKSIQPNDIIHVHVLNAHAVPANSSIGTPAGEHAAASGSVAPSGLRFRGQPMTIAGATGAAHPAAPAVPMVPAVHMRPYIAPPFHRPHGAPPFPAAITPQLFFRALFALYVSVIGCLW